MIVEFAVGGRVCQLLVVNDVGVEFLCAQRDNLEDDMRPVKYDRPAGTHDLFIAIKILAAHLEECRHPGDSSSDSCDAQSQ